VVLDDQNFIRSTKALIQDHSRLNLSSQGWQPPSDCINSDERYGGLDFRTRDALHYHVYNLEAWTWILRFAPELIDEQTLARIKEAFDFLHPYYLGQRTHIEFACTTVKFDILRKNEGQDQFQNKNWEAFRAKRLLLMAQVPLPEVRIWQASNLTGSEPSWLKFISSFKP
jgi:hypothetical protein